jgi:predicted TIM-barrel fold metal-dependent hydrolase
MDVASLSWHDANCTVGRFPNHGRGLVDMEGMADTLGELGIQRALVRHSLGRFASPEEANAALAEAIGDDERWTPCWTLNPAHTPDGLEEMNGRIRAVSLYPKMHGYPLCDWMLEESLAPLAESGALVLLELDETSLTDLYAFSRAFPGLRIVVLNTGYRVPGALSRLLATRPNLYVELSTLANYRGIETLAQRHGADRLLFGTNTPLSDGIGPLAAFRHAAISASERALIAGGTLTRMLSEVRL